ncbi:global cell cycle regulator GcrA-like protein [Phaeovibrio sulfidiphilus]|uniref:Global cell cycle regulator GcrA-like protein n=1 Tax=Phaeovibrio sulfidiphilus TaxID=1220600 RepID=A0A8J6YNS1_9PROT|nr:GcrA family cell cycle regulator [Phaeovibrio sulfidiphilus]MBE1237955.1 global cell cycle regulator GcrA-like protein [Phaeovibrio sulfidiphilus]
MVWNDDTVERLKKLWADGLTTGDIGKQLGVSKNAVVGKAHRLGLKARPSPIKRTKKEKDEKIRSVVDLKADSCRWPIGDPRHPNFHFCGKTAIPGKPYCSEHAQIAYVSSSRVREEEPAPAAPAATAPAQGAEPASES